MVAAEFVFVPLSLVFYSEIDDEQGKLMEAGIPGTCTAVLCRAGFDDVSFLSSSVFDNKARRPPKPQ